MGKEQEPSIIRSAREYNVLLEQQKESMNRLEVLVKAKAIRQRLGGAGSALVLQSRVFGKLKNMSFCVEVRGDARSFTDCYALDFSSGDFSRSFVFDESGCAVWDTHMDMDRERGKWIGSPPEDLRRNPTISDLTQLNEAMDLFEQNVGKSINRD